MISSNGTSEACRPISTELKQDVASRKERMIGGIFQNQVMCFRSCQVDTTLQMFDQTR